MPKEDDYRTIVHRSSKNGYPKESLEEDIKNISSHYDLLNFLKEKNLLPTEPFFAIDEREKIKVICSGDPGAYEVTYSVGLIDGEAEFVETFVIRRRFLIHCYQSAKWSRKALRIYATNDTHRISQFEREKFFHKQRYEYKIWTHFKQLLFKSICKLLSKSKARNIRLENILYSLGAWNPDSVHANGYWLANFKNILAKHLPNIFEVEEEYTSMVCCHCGISNCGNIVAINENLVDENGERIYKLLKCNKCKIIMHRDVAGSKNIFLKTKQLFHFNESVYPTRNIKQSEDMNPSEEDK